MPNIPTAKQFYDKISVLLTNYEGNGSANIPMADGFYELLVELQRNWDSLFSN